MLADYIINKLTSLNRWGNNEYQYCFCVWSESTIEASTGRRPLGLSGDDPVRGSCIWMAKEGVGSTKSSLGEQSGFRTFLGRGKGWGTKPLCSLN